MVDVDETEYFQVALVTIEESFHAGELSVGSFVGVILGVVDILRVREEVCKCNGGTALDYRESSMVITRGGCVGVNMLLHLKRPADDGLQKARSGSLHKCGFRRRGNENRLFCELLSDDVYICVEILTIEDEKVLWSKWARIRSVR